MTSTGHEHAAKDDAFARAATSGFHVDFLADVATSTRTCQGSAASVQGLPPGSAVLVVTRGPNVGSQFLLDQASTSAGRHPDSDILLDDVTVSRRHVEFRLGHDVHGVQLVDRESLNGTYVNHERVEATVLAHGDEIQVGKFELIFLCT